MFKKYLACMLLLYVVHLPTLFAQYHPLTGKWVGKITQTGKDNVANDYHFELNLVVDTIGKELKGYSFSFIRQAVGKYALKASLVGRLQAQQIFLDETGVLEYENTIVKKADYCVKHIELALDTTNGKLVGSWRGVLSKTQALCEGGKIWLEKWKPLPQTDTSMVLEGEKLLQLQNRTVKKGKTLTVHHTKLKIAIFDDAEVDDDVVAVNFNGRWLAQNYKLKAQPRYFTLQIVAHQPYNFLAIAACNLGKMPPNTTAVEIQDGEKTHKVLLKSDLGETDVLYFEYEEQK